MLPGATPRKRSKMKVNNPSIPAWLSDLPLHPGTPCYIDLFRPYEISLLDPFTAFANPEARSRIAALRADTASAMAGRISWLTGDGVRGLRVMAARENWLLLEQRITQVCIDLLWAAHLMPTAGTSEWLHSEQALCSLLEQDALPPVCEPLFQASGLPTLCSRTLDLVARALPRLHEVASDIEVDSESWFWWVYNTLHEPVPRWDMHAYESVAQRIAHSLADMPVFEGLLIVGSFAEEEKHDGFNDIDLYCYCSVLPDQQMRTAFFTRLGLDRQGATIAFEYLQLDGVNVHLCFALLDNQQRAIARLWHDGDESDCGQFLNPLFAASAYHLAHGRILNDPTGKLGIWQAQVSQYPSSLRKRIHQLWRPVWQRFAPRVQQALDYHDRVHALIALSYCREAYLRILLANNSVLCDPISLKWLLHEIRSLPSPQRDILMPAITTVRFDGIPTLTDQFVKLKAAWDEVQ